MPYSAYKRATLLIPSGPTGLHLYVVMTDASKHNQHILLSVSTIRAGKYFDDTCVIDAGSHEFIVRDSYVYYRDPLLRNAASISKCVNDHTFISKADMDENVFTRMLNGVPVSKFTPKWVGDYF